jgi:hypothetical protein
MIFHISYEYLPEQRDEVHARFKETGAPPPSGHCVEGNRGFLVAESSEAEAIGRWLQEWTDALSFEVTPVLTDEQFTQVIT